MSSAYLVRSRLVPVQLPSQRARMSPPRWSQTSQSPENIHLECDSSGSVKKDFDLWLKGDCDCESVIMVDTQTI